MICFHNHFSLRPIAVCQNEVKETCLVESYNSSIRDTFARLNRKTKTYSKSKYMLDISVELVIYEDIICSDRNSINKYCRYYANDDKMEC